MESDEVVLEIEGSTIKCQKEILISNSDYFKAMFEGNFIEKNKNIIQLKDVDLQAMNIILTLLWDETHYIEDEDVLVVLQTSSMLQFEKIRNICLEKILKILCVKNCLKIWISTEQLGLKPLYLKAKAMALTEFMLIRDSSAILELTLLQLYNYLGHISVKTDNELSVFQTAMKWWYENSNKYEHSTSALLKLLTCIDYKKLLSNFFKEVLTYPSIAGTEISEILECLHNIIYGESTEKFSQKHIQISTVLNATKDRRTPSYPCMLVKAFITDIDDREDGDLIISDVYKRKRPLQALTKKNDAFHVVYFDHQLNQFETFFQLKQKLQGFKLIEYKEYIFMYGGEYEIGRGEWNRSFWAYDTIREIWQSKSTLPYPRRHFEACVIGSKIVTVGGTGVFRISHQDNMFWYDFKDNVWSKEKSLPCFDRQIKCCNFLDKFFLFSINNRHGYFFEDFSNWVHIPVNFDQKLFNSELDFSIFSYKNKLYVKGQTMVELTLTDNQLVISSTKTFTLKEYETIQITLCDNLVFTLYKYSSCDPESCSMYTLEKYDLDTGDESLIFDNLLETDVLHTKDGSYVIHDSLQMIPFAHYNLVGADELVQCNSFDTLGVCL